MRLPLNSSVVLSTRGPNPAQTVGTRVLALETRRGARDVRRPTWGRTTTARCSSRLRDQPHQEQKGGPSGSSVRTRSHSASSSPAPHPCPPHSHGQGFSGAEGILPPSLSRGGLMASHQVTWELQDQEKSGSQAQQQEGGLQGPRRSKEAQREPGWP